MSVNRSAISDCSAMSTKPTGKFNDKETTYLRERLPEYIAATTQGPVKKGDKGKWVNKHILDEFKERFGYSPDGDGPGMASVDEKLRRWFTNNGRLATTTKPTVAQPAEKPRAKNALDIFAEEKKADIVKATKLLADIEGPKAPGWALNPWKQAWQAMFDDLNPEEKERYESKAKEFNEKLKSPPDVKVIYGNQANLIPMITEKLLSLSGWDWGQCGPLVCFVQVGYRDDQDKLQTLTVSVSDDPNIKEFKGCLSDYDAICNQFKQWAAGYLPEKPSPTTHADDILPAITISLDEDKFPHLLSPEDLEDVSFKMIKKAITDYMIASWEHARPRGCDAAIPWGSLESAARWELLANPDRLATFPHLNPAQLSGDEAFRMVKLISDAQAKHEASPLKFSVTAETLNALHLGASPSLTKSIDSHDKGKEKAAPPPAHRDDHSLTDADGDRSASSEPTTESAGVDGDTSTNDGSPGTSNSVSTDVYMEDTDESASIAGQDDSNNKEPSTSIPVTRAQARKSSATVSSPQVRTSKSKWHDIGAGKRASHEDADGDRSASSEPTTESAGVDGDTPINDGSPGTSNSVEDTDESASIAGQDDSNDKEPSTSVPVTRAQARKSSATVPSPQVRTSKSKQHDIGAGKRASHEEIGDAPRKKGKWADLPPRTSCRIRRDGYIHTRIGQRK